MTLTADVLTTFKSGITENHLEISLTKHDNDILKTLSAVKILLNK